LDLRDYKKGNPNGNVIAADGMLFYLTDKINNAKEDSKEFIKFHLRLMRTKVYWDIAYMD
jgi:hypothetical protein